ncbi:MAG: hypothetical protein ACI81L_001645 [Verrucomicrobiales bacterium]|jgi:hypothetical protein
MVEPMRTEDAHQPSGLARRILTTGIDLLAKAGAERIKIGFEPVKRTAVFSGRTSASNSSPRGSAIVPE